MITGTTTHDRWARLAISCEAAVRHRGLLGHLSDRDLQRYVGDLVWFHHFTLDEVLAFAARRDAIARNAAFGVIEAPV